MLESSTDSILQEDLNIIANSDLPWKELDNSSILVTGATGLIGSQIIKAILCRNRLTGAKTKILAHARNLEKAKKIFTDVLDREELKFIISDITHNIDFDEPIDYLVHTASITVSKEMVARPVEVIRTSLDGTQKVLELAHKKGIKGAVYLSSMEAFGVVQASDKRASENDLGQIDLTNPRSCYPEGKRMAECICAAYASEYNLPVKIARLSQTFGAGITYTENRVFAQFAKSAIEKKDIVLHTSGQSFGNYCYTRDTIRAILLLLVKGKNGEPYTVTNENSNVRICEMAQMVASEIANDEIKVVFDIPDDLQKYGYAPDTALHLSSAKLQQLGWKPSVSLKETYERMIKSMLVTR